MLQSGLLKYDLTELPGLDNLSCPTGVIKEAQEAAAATFGADRSWFLVNGSTVGLHAAVMAVAGPSDVLLVARNCHLSTFNGMVLAGCRPHWVQPEFDPVHGIAHTVTPESLGHALTGPGLQRVKGVLVVSPTYFGVAADIKGLADICHRHGLPLIVDEAHGAHFSLHPAFPSSALSQGADIVVQSTHKVLTALTQSAMLHVKGPRVDHDRVSSALLTLQTSSPSYLLMASLDAARLTAQDPASFSTAVEGAEYVRKQLANVPGIIILGGETTRSCPSTSGVETHHCSTLMLPIDDASLNLQSPGHDYDPLRIVVNVSGLGLSGYEAQEKLENLFGVVPELSSTQLVVLVIGPGNSFQDCQKLVMAFEKLSHMQIGPSPWAPGTLPAPPPQCERQDTPPQSHQHPSGSPSKSSAIPYSGVVGHVVMSPREAFFSKKIGVSLTDAVGKVSGSLLCPYPPGVPVVYPGEIITEQALQVLRSTLHQGGLVVGAPDPDMTSVLTIVDGGAVEKINEQDECTDGGVSSRDNVV